MRAAQRFSTPWHSVSVLVGASILVSLTMGTRQSMGLLWASPPAWRRS